VREAAAAAAAARALICTSIFWTCCWQTVKSSLAPILMPLRILRQKRMNRGFPVGALQQ
jgi:hypothetical protein